MCTCVVRCNRYENENKRHLARQACVLWYIRLRSSYAIYVACENAAAFERWRVTFGVYVCVFVCTHMCVRLYMLMRLSVCAVRVRLGRSDSQHSNCYQFVSWSRLEWQQQYFCRCRRCAAGSQHSTNNNRHHRHTTHIRSRKIRT